MSSLNGTNIQLLLDNILSNEKNITPELVAEKIELLKNSRYLSMQSSLRDGSIMSLQPSLSKSKHSYPAPNGQMGGGNGGGAAAAGAGNFEEESKIDTNSSSNNNNSRQLD